MTDEGSKTDNLFAGSNTRILVVPISESVLTYQQKMYFRNIFSELLHLNKMARALAEEVGGARADDVAAVLGHRIVTWETLINQFDPLAELSFPKEGDDVSLVVENITRPQGGPLG